MVAYLMAVVSSIPNTAARCRGSAPQVRASSSCRSTRSRSRVAVRPRHDPVSQFSLTGPGGHGGLLVDDQVRVGGAGPAAAAVLQPGQEQACGQVIERAGPAGDDQPPVAEVDVAEDAAPGWSWAGRRGRRPGRPRGGRRGDGGGGGLVYLGGLQRLDEDQGTLAVAGRRGWGRGRSCRSSWQWPNSERRAVRVCRRWLPGRRPGGGDDVGGGDLAQVGVVPGPGQQQRVDPVEVIRTVCSSRGRLRGPPWLRVRSQCPTSAAIGAAAAASRAGQPGVKDGTRSSSRSPASRGSRRCG